MSFSPSGKRWLGAALAVSLGLASVYADGKNEKIQFSGPGGSTNLVRSARPSAKIKFSGPEDNVDSGAVDPDADRLNPPPGAFRQAQEALLAPFINRMRHPPDSMQGVLTMPRQQPPQNPQTSERARQLLDQRRNWAFSDYNDLNGADPTTTSLDGSHPGAAASGDKSVSLVERYYQRLGRQQPDTRTRSLKDALESAQDYAIHEEDLDPSTSPLMTDKNFFKQLDAFGADAVKKKNRGPDGRPPKADLFGNPIITDPNALIAAQQRRDDFQKLLDPSYVPTPAKSSFNPIYSDHFGQPASLTTSTDPAPAIVAHRNPLNTFNQLLDDPTHLALHSSVYDNPTAAALGLPNPVPVTPQAQPMTLEKMQSMIDPTAVFKKHNF